MGEQLNPKATKQGKGAQHPGKGVHTLRAGELTSQAELSENTLEVYAQGNIPALILPESIQLTSTRISQP